MALSFPPTPVIGQAYQQWIWDGQKWVCSCVGVGPPVEIGNGVIGMPSKTIMFTNSGVYTPSAGITSIMVECVGGGGAGGNAASLSTFAYAGGGGASGGYSRSVILPAVFGTSQPVTVGAGGAPGAGLVNGGNGGATSFGTLVVANGGSGGFFNNGSNAFGQGGPPAIVGTGIVALPGSPGSMGVTEQQPVTLAIGGHGGSMWGGGAGNQGTLAGGGFPGGAGQLGGGGGGACSASNPGSTIFQGGAGGSGFCIVTEYSP